MSIKIIIFVSNIIFDMVIEIDNNLFNNIKEYCFCNNIIDVSNFINTLLKKKFMEEKYGDRPNINNKPNLNNKVVNEEKKVKENKQPFWDFVKKIEGDDLRIIMEIGREYSDNNKDPNNYIEEIKKEFNKRIKSLDSVFSVKEDIEKEEISKNKKRKLVTK